MKRLEIYQCVLWYDWLSDLVRTFFEIILYIMSNGSDACGMTVGKNLDGDGLDMSSKLAACFWRRLINNTANLGQNSRLGRVLSVYKYGGSHKNVTTNYMHNNYCYCTMLLHVSAMHFGHLQGATSLNEEYSLEGNFSQMNVRLYAYTIYIYIVYVYTYIWL
jgi:hypothetical protein